MTTYLNAAQIKSLEPIVMFFTNETIRQQVRDAISMTEDDITVALGDAEKSPHSLTTERKFRAQMASIMIATKGGYEDGVRDSMELISTEFFNGTLSPRNYLFNYSGNWADEMSLVSKVIITDETKAKIENALNNFQSFSISVGSNQSIEYDSESEARNAFSIQELTNEEAATLKKFGIGAYPMSKIADRFIEWLCDPDM